MTDSKFDFEIKLMLLGDQAVGKSSLITRYTEDQFYENMLGTAGIDFKKKILEVNNKKGKVTIFDTAGHERFRKINKNYYKNAKGIVLVYDITDRTTFDNVRDWMKSITESTENNSIQILLIGNKYDLEDRNVSLNEGENISKEFGVDFMETSAKTGGNVENAFMVIVKKILERENIIEKEIQKEKTEKKIENVILNEGEKVENKEKQEINNNIKMETENQLVTNNDNKQTITLNNNSYQNNININNNPNVEPKKKKKSCCCN
jgi:small GTP-binding protein